MNTERPTLYHTEQQPTQPVDYVTIANPLGRSPYIEQHQNDSDESPEEETIEYLSEWLSVPPDSILLAKGSSAIIDVIPTAFTHPGDTCILPIPTYFALKTPLENAGVQIIRVPTSPENNYAINKDYIDRLLTDVRSYNPALIWICTPNNPTGAIWDLRDIQEVSQNTNALIVIDEAYHEYIDPYQTQSAIRLLCTTSNILVTKTFSKAFGIPDARIGIAIGHPDTLSRLHSFPIEKPTALATTQASLALQDMHHVERSAKYMQTESRYVQSRVNAMRYIELGSDPSCGMLIIRHRTANLYQLLLNMGIQSMDINTQEGLEGLGYVRIGLKDRMKNEYLMNILSACDRSFLE